VPLSPTRQLDFSAGMFRSVQNHLIPQSGAYDLLNYLLDADGAAYRRGGVLEYSDAFGDDGLTFVWDGHLAPGPRTVIANRHSFGVLDVDQRTPIDVGGGGLLDPVRAHVIEGHLVWDGGVTYGGSRKGADYSTGSVKVSLGSAVVEGTGTVWSPAAVDAGMLFRIDGGGREYIVKSIDATNRLTLTEPYQGATQTGRFYRLARTGLAARIAASYAVIGKRLFAFDGDKAAFTPYGEPAVFNADDEHQIPGGSEILGGDGIGDSAIVFTTEGVWGISNISLEPFDDFGNVQQRLDHLNPVVLWHKEGIARWNESLIVPGLDGIWLLGSGAMRRLDASIGPFYRDYVVSGLKTGLAWVDRSTYFLPILQENNDVVDLLACRLDRPTRSRVGEIFPWTHLRGKGAGRAGVVRTSKGAGPVTLLAASVPELLEARYFEPDANVPDDLGTVIEDSLTTRAFPTGAGNQNVTRRAQLDYELWDTQENDNPTVALEYSTGVRRDDVTDWGQFAWGEADWADPDSADYVEITTAPEDLVGVVQANFAIDEPPRSRYISFRLRSSGRLAKLLVRGITFWSRQSTKAD
jgi:hypothetical protein